LIVKVPRVHLPALLSQLSALALLSTTLPAATVQVYLLAGQSNANAGVESGVESTMNNWLGAANFELVRSEHGGSPLWMWSNGGTRGTNYMDDLAALAGRMESIEAAGDEAVFGGLLWVQGESDIFAPSTISIYDDRFQAMLGFYQQDLGLAEAPTYTVGLVDANQSPAYDSQVNRADVEALRTVLFSLGEAENGGAVDMRGYDRTDIWHLTIPASNAFGNSLALDILNTNQVPEPSAALLAVLGSALAAFRRRR
jgi:hypothetical protein